MYLAQKKAAWRNGGTKKMQHIKKQQNVKCKSYTTSNYIKAIILCILRKG